MYIVAMMKKKKTARAYLRRPRGFLSEIHMRINNIYYFFLVCFCLVFVVSVVAVQKNEHTITSSSLFLTSAAVDPMVLLPIQVR